MACILGEHHLLGRNAVGHAHVARNHRIHFAAIVVAH